MFSLTKVRDGVYHLEFESPRELGMTFVRYQEFYESQYDHIREKSFSLVEQMGTYVRLQNKDENSDWSYPNDWGGYNIPAEVIKQCIDAGIPDPNFYDAFMKGVYHFIMADCNHGKAYLIGTYLEEVDEDATEEDLEKKAAKEEGYFKHEMTHAMFYLVPEYKEACLEFLGAIDNDLRKELFAAIYEHGYPEKVTLDEIQAYITTGEAGYFDEVKNQNGLDILRNQLRSLWREHYPTFYETDDEAPSSSG